MTVTAQLPGPLWQRVLVLGAIFVGAGAVFAIVSWSGAAAGNPPDIRVFDAFVGILAAGLGMMSVSVWIKRLDPKEHPRVK